MKHNTELWEPLDLFAVKSQKNLMKSEINNGFSIISPDGGRLKTVSVT